MIDLLYLDGHLTNLVLFPIFFVSLFFIIRFIELVDHGYLPVISNVTCKKCRTRYGLLQVCKHDKYSIFVPLMPSLFGYFAFVFLIYTVIPYLKSLAPLEITISPAVITKQEWQSPIIVFIDWIYKIILGAL